MANEFEEYFKKQAGSGYGPYAGLRFQRGNGMLGRIFSKALSFLLPGIKYAGKKGLQHGIEFGKQVMDGNDFKTAAKRQLRKATEDIARDASHRIASEADALIDQSGSGRLKNYKKAQTKKKPTIKKKAPVKHKAKTPAKKPAKSIRISKKDLDYW